MVTRRFDGSLGGISFTEFMILYHLSQANDEKMRRIDLASKVGLTASGITRLLLPMEKIGLIKKESNAQDARVSFVLLALGGKTKLEEAVENAEDSKTQGWHDLKSHHVNGKDVVIGIAASGTTPYVIAALKKCREHGVVTGCITNNPGSPIVSESDFPIEVVVGPEFVTGSTRMKSGTSQKLVLNMISTTVMIQLGRVEDNKMVNMLLSNEKLLDRGTKMLMEQLNLINYDEANKLLRKYGSVKKAAENFQQSH